MALNRWVANTKRVLAHDKLSNTDFEFQSEFPDGVPDGTPFSAAEMNKIIDAINSFEAEYVTLAPLNGFAYTGSNYPNTAAKVGREVHIQIGMRQLSIVNRIFTQLPAGMYDGAQHIIVGTDGSNGGHYPIIIDPSGAVSFNGSAAGTIYLNASFILEG